MKKRSLTAREILLNSLNQRMSKRDFEYFKDLINRMREEENAAQQAS